MVVFRRFSCICRLEEAAALALPVMSLSCSFSAMHLVPSSLYLPVTPVANARTTRSAGISQVPALAPPLFLYLSSAAARKSDSTFGERGPWLFGSPSWRRVYATMCGAKHVRVTECFDTAIPVIIKKEIHEQKLKELLAHTYIHASTYLPYRFDRVPVQTRVISRFGLLRSYTLLYTFHLYSLHSRGRDTRWFVSWPVAQQHQRRKFQLHKKKRKKSEEEQQSLVPRYRLVSLSSGVSSLWRCAVGIPEAPFLAAPVVIAPTPAGDAAVSLIYSPPPHHPQTPSFACL